MSDEITASGSPTEREFGGTTRLMQIREPDLAELERLLPELLFDLLMSRATEGEASPTNIRHRTMYRAVQQIIVNVRWNYGPPMAAGIIT